MCAWPARLSIPIGNPDKTSKINEVVEIHRTLSSSDRGLGFNQHDGVLNRPLQVS